LIVGKQHAELLDLILNLVSLAVTSKLLCSCLDRIDIGSILLPQLRLLIIRQI
jgi:hypothetical protein